MSKDSKPTPLQAEKDGRRDPEPFVESQNRSRSCLDCRSGRRHKRQLGSKGEKVGLDHRDRKMTNLPILSIVDHISSTSLLKSKGVYSFTYVICKLLSFTHYLNNQETRLTVAEANFFMYIP